MQLCHVLQGIGWNVGAGRPTIRWARIREAAWWVRRQPRLTVVSPRKCFMGVHLGGGHCAVVWAVVPLERGEHKRKDILSLRRMMGGAQSKKKIATAAMLSSGISETILEPDGGRFRDVGISQNSSLVTAASINQKDSFNVSDSTVKVNQKRWFPYLDHFRVENTTLTSAEILDMLDQFIFEERKQKIWRVVANRTYSICPIVEGVVDTGNISAVFRSADALGFQSLHVISNQANKSYKKNRNVSMGSEKWLDTEQWNTTVECLETMHRRGYRIVVAHASDDTVSIHDMDWTIPTAVVFGNELRGVSEEAMQMSDLRCSIPMSGMVASFNVSVAAGILMHHIVHDRIARSGRHGDLLHQEQQVLAAEFYLRHNRQMSSVIHHLLGNKQSKNQCFLSSVLKGELENDIDLPEYLRIQGKL
eukprot:c21365_g1_i1 orf=201-1457(-)